MKTISKSSLNEMVKNNTIDYLENFLDDYVLQEFKDGKRINIQELIDIIEDKRDFTYEFAESNTPVYYKDLADWFAGNFSEVDDYVQEFGINEKDFSIMNTIAGAYTMQIVKELEKEIYDFVEELQELLEEEAK